MQTCAYYIRLDDSFGLPIGSPCLISHSFSLNLPTGSIIDAVEQSDRGVNLICRVPQLNEASTREEKKVLLCQVGTFGFGVQEITEVTSSDRFLGLLTRLSLPAFHGASYAAYEVSR